MKTLIIDDDINVLECYKNIIGSDHVSLVDFMDNPKTALEILQSGNKIYNRVISEMFFENVNINGFDILNAARRQNISERIILTSISNPVINRLTNATLFIRKPLTKRKIEMIVYDPIEEISRAFGKNEFSKTPAFSMAKSVFI